jgi:serine/threonine-protein kinase RsbW
MTQPSKEISMTIAARLENVSLAGLAVRGICSDTDLSKTKIFEVESSVVEAVNNVILHAYRQRPDVQVEIFVAVLPEQIVIEIRDQGVGMEAFKPGLLDYNIQDLDNLPEGGMGLAIIEQNMDEVLYRKNNGVNVLTMKKHLTA